MTLDEIFRRLVRAHLLLLVVCLVAPVAAVAYYEARASQTWVATVRLQVAATAPSSATQADALSSRVLALATTPYLVGQALRGADLPGNATTIVDHDISSRRLGESPVVELSVQNPSRKLARAEVQAIARRVVTFMNDGNQRAFRAQLAAVRAQLATAVAARDRQARTLARRLTPSPLEQAQLADAQAAVDRLNTTAAQLEVTDATRDLVVLINGEQPQLVRTSSGLVPRSALAGLLGLLLGISLAVLLETLRPRAAGVRSVARALGAPVIARGAQGSGALHQALTLACRRQGVDTVALVGVDATSETIARRLLAELRTVEGEVRRRSSERVGGRGDNQGRDHDRDDRTTPDPALARVRFCTLGEVSATEEVSAGLLVVSVGSPLQRDVESVADIVQTTRWPVIGIVDPPAGSVWGRR